MNKDKNLEQAIIDTAEKLFLDKGFEKTKTTEIAKIVGCNQALVHYYYRTKEKLFEAVFEKKARLFLSTLFREEDKKLTFEKKLKKKIEAHFDILRENPKLPFLILNELTTNKERVIAIKKNMGELPINRIKQFQSELQQEIKKGKIRKVSLLDLLITVLSLNVTLFITQPIIKTITGISDAEYEKFITKRKEENVRIILDSLKP